MSGKSKKRRRDGIPGVSPSALRLAKISMKMARDHLAVIQKLGGDQFFLQAARAMELSATNKDALRIASSLHRHINADILAVTDWPGRDLGLMRLNLAYISQAASLIAQLDDYYRSLMVPGAVDSNQSSVALLPRAEIRVSLASLAQFDADACNKIVEAAMSAGILARNLAGEMFYELDSAIRAAHLAAVGEWSDYSVRLTDLLPRTQKYELPANYLGYIYREILEVEEDGRKKVDPALEKLSKEIESVREAVQKSGQVDGYNPEPPVTNVSVALASKEESASTPTFWCRVIKRHLVVQTDMPVLVAPMSRRIIGEESDVGLDRQLVEQTSTGGPGTASKDISATDPYDGLGDPAVTTTLVWWTRDDGGLYVEFVVDGAKSAQISYEPIRGKITKQATLLTLFLENHKSGLGFGAALKEIYADDTDIKGVHNIYMLIMRMRSLLYAIGACCVRTGCDRRIFPDSWGVKTVGMELRLRVANVVRIKGKEEAKNGRTYKQFEER